GSQRREATLHDLLRPVSPARGDRLPGGLPLSVASDRWACGKRRHPSCRPVPRFRPLADRWGALLVLPHPLLAGPQRRLPEHPVRRGSIPVRARDPRRGSRSLSVPALAVLSFVDHRLPGVPGLSVGQPPAGDGLPCHPRRSPRAALRSRPVEGAPAPRPAPRAAAAVPPHLLFGSREARQRRSELAEFHGAAIPLRDAAHSEQPELVHAPASGVVSEALLHRHVLL